MTTQATRHSAREVRETGRMVRGMVEVCVVPRQTVAEVAEEAALMDTLAGLRLTRPVVFRPWQVGRGKGRRV